MVNFKTPSTKKVHGAFVAVHSVKLARHMHILQGNLLFYLLSHFCLQSKSTISHL